MARTGSASTTGPGSSGETLRTGGVTAPAAVLRELGAVLSLEDIAVPDPGPGEVRVRVRGVGICHTDVSATDGTMPRPLPTVLGHEGAGVVESVGEGVRTVAVDATVGFRGNRNVVAVDQGHLLFGRGLLGVIEGDADPHALIPELLALHARGEFPFERLITTYPFEQVDEALAAVGTGDVVKPVLVFPSDPSPDARHDGRPRGS